MTFILYENMLHDNSDNLNQFWSIITLQMNEINFIFLA